MKQCDVFVILDDVQLERNSFVNRNRINVTKGNPWLTIPVEMTGHMEKTIRQMVIANEPWVDKHWCKLKAVYANAPHFLEWAAKWYVAMRNVDRSLMAPMHFTLDMARELGVESEIVKQSDIGIVGHKNQLIVNLCKHFGAHTFVFGAQGMEYCDFELMRENGIRPIFQEYRAPTDPALSVLHHLVTEGKEATKELINKGVI